MPTLHQRLEGGLLGLLVGDALGVPYEYHQPRQLPNLEEIEFNPPAAFHRAHAGTPPGTWSDDGAQALCLLASLLECGRLDPEDLARRLLRWCDQGYMAVDNRVLDVGITTSRAIGTLRSGCAALEAGPASENSNGAGAMMRALPLALWHQGSDAELARDAQTQSRVTHGHPRSQLCCAIYCLWARRVLQEHTTPYRDAVETLSKLCEREPESLVEIDLIIRPLAAPDVPGAGYVVDCLRSARLAVEAGNFEFVLKRAVQMGHDAATTASVAGGIAGLRDGVEAIPARWQSFLRGVSVWRPLLQLLLDHHGRRR